VFILVDYYFAVAELDFFRRDRVGHLQPEKVLRVAGARTHELHARDVNRTLSRVPGSHHNELLGLSVLDNWMSLIVLYAWAPTTSGDMNNRTSSFLLFADTHATKLPIASAVDRQAPYMASAECPRSRKTPHFCS
jgi:hypothetical protein